MAVLRVLLFQSIADRPAPCDCHRASNISATWHILVRYRHTERDSICADVCGKPAAGLSADSNLAGRSIRPLVVIRLFGKDRIA